MTTIDVGLAQRRGTVAFAGREVRRVLSLWTQTILPAVLTAVLFLAVFGGALGTRIGEVEGVAYLDFILPGLLVIAVATQAFANTSTSIYQAKSEGYIEDVLSSPLRPWQLALAYMAGGLVRGLAAATAIALLAAPFVGGLQRPAIAVAALVLTGLLFSALGVITGIWAETFDQHSFVAAVVIAPLALLGGVFYASRSLNEPWGTITRIDPLYYLVDGTRAGLIGVHESATWAFSPPPRASLSPPSPPPCCSSRAGGASSPDRARRLRHLRPPVAPIPMYGAQCFAHIREQVRRYPDGARATS